MVIGKHSGISPPKRNHFILRFPFLPSLSIGPWRRIVGVTLARGGRPGVSALSTSVIRSSERPNIQKPRHPSFERLKLLTLSEPSHPHPHPTTATLSQDCPLEAEWQILSEKDRASPLEVLYGQELCQWLEQSRMVGLYHANVMTYYPARSVRYLLTINWFW